MSNETKVIPKEIWKKFVDEYWDEVLFVDFKARR
jgi:hypothetical protein